MHKKELNVFKGIKSPVMVLVGLVLAGSAHAEQNNPFAFKDVPKVEHVQTIAPVINSELSNAQREQVLGLLTKFLSDSGLNTGDSIYEIGDGKRYFIVPDDDKFVGKISGKLIIFDSSRNKNIYVDSSKYDDVITQDEHEAMTKDQKESISEVGEKLIQGITSSAGNTFKQPPAPKGIILGDRTN